MKYNNTIEILKTTLNAITNPMYMADRIAKSEAFKFPRNLDLNNSMDNNIYIQSESSNEEYDESIPMEASEPYSDNESKGCYNKQQDTYSNPQGVIDSIANEITPVRLQQAIILSEIVGKPRSKTRRKRRF